MCSTSWAPVTATWWRGAWLWVWPRSRWTRSPARAPPPPAPSSGAGIASSPRTQAQCTDRTQTEGYMTPCHGKSECVRMCHTAYSFQTTQKYLYLLYEKICILDISSNLLVCLQFNLSYHRTTDTLSYHNTHIIKKDIRCDV